MLNVIINLFLRPAAVFPNFVNLSFKYMTQCTSTLQFDYLILPQKHFGQDFLPIFPSKGLNHLCGLSLPLFFFMTLSFTIPSPQK